MKYLLKHYDKPLLIFNLKADIIAGLSIDILHINEQYRHFLPLDLSPTNAGLLTWLKCRVIPKNRAFVQELLTKLKLNVNDTKGIIDICKGLFINDCYWVVDETFAGIFDQYNLYDNRFDESLSLIAYTGHGTTIHNEFASTPELTTNGVLAKSWRRINGKIVLYKAGSTGAANIGNEPYSEFYAYQIAREMGLNAVQYNLHQWKKRLCSSCELFNDKAHAFIPTGRIVTTGGWKAVLDYYQGLGEDYYTDLIDI